MAKIISNMIARFANRGFGTMSVPLSRPKVLSEAQINAYEADGYVILKDILPSSVKENLTAWARLLEDLPETPGKWMKYYEIDSNTGERLLCRVENFSPFFKDLKNLTEGLIKDVSSELFGEEASLYKEKINFKMPKGNGFNAHQDQPAFTSFGINTLLTVLLPVDPNTRLSGGIDIVAREHRKKEIMPQNTDGSIRTDIEAKLNWLPVDVYPGDLVFFDSYAPHRSDVNLSTFTRRNIYLTYNPSSLGYFRDKYYDEKRRLFPPECERDPNKDYSEGARVFNVANPIK